MNIRLALTLALLAPLVALSGIPSLSQADVAHAQTATPTLHVFGSRSARQRPGTPGAKLDSTLADLTNHVNVSGGPRTLSEMRSLTPAARFIQRSSDATPLVLVDAVTRGDAQQLRKALVALGLQKPSVYSNVVSGWLPVNQLDAAAARAELHSMNAVMFTTRAGALTTQGDFAQGSANLRSNNPSLDGTGIVIGALSDSYNCYNYYATHGYPASGAQGYAPNGITTDAAGNIQTGDLPATVNVLVEATCQNYGSRQLPFADEGRAMLEIIHDIAPGAGLAFYTAENGEAAFASGIAALASQAKAKVIVDDVGFFDEPFFQDGLIAQAIDAVFAQGVAYFSSAGNDAAKSFENTAPMFITQPTTGPQAGERLLNFDNTNATNTTTLTVNIPAMAPGRLIPLVLEWDDPYVKGASGSPGATSRLNMCVTGSGSNLIIDSDGNTETCTGANATGSDPVQILIVFNPADSGITTPAETLSVTIGLADGTAQPHRVKLAVEDDGAGATMSAPGASLSNPTVQGHPGAMGAAAVGAAAFYNTPLCGVTPAVLETYSSLGGGPILFDKTGARLATPEVRQKPNFVAPDRANSTFFGRLGLPATLPDNSTVMQCADNTSYPHFAGTSAASPHAAAAAALLLQWNSTLTPTQIYTALQKTALSMATSPSPDYSSGYGFIQADAALKSVMSLPPNAPTLTLATGTLVEGATTTLTWSSGAAQSCSATGGWTTSQATSGSATITAPSTAGSTTYSMTCSNANGQSDAGSVTLTVTAPPPSAGSSGGGGGGGGGGGAIDQIVLLVLGVTLGTRLWGRAPRRYPQSCRARPAGLHRSRSR